MRMLLGLFAAALVTSAVADDWNESRDQALSSTNTSFAQLDRNEDDRVSKAEAENDDNVSSQFASIDQDSDGYIDKSEFTARLEQDSSSRERSDSWTEQSDSY